MGTSKKIMKRWKNREKNIHNEDRKEWKHRKGKKTSNQYTDWDKWNIECFTPKYGVELIVPHLKKMQKKLNRQLVVWCPFSKNEHWYVKIFKEVGFKVLNSHLDYGQDFFKYQPKEEWDVMIDNPPFKDKTAFVSRAMSFKKPFAFLLPLRALELKTIPALFYSFNIPIEILLPIEKMEFENQPGRKNGIVFKVIYMCSRILEKQIVIADMKKENINWKGKELINKYGQIPLMDMEFDIKEKKYNINFESDRIKQMKGEE